MLMLLAMTLTDGTLKLDGLDLRHLEALRAVANEGTFGKAAEALGYTQSAVSQQIAALERITDERLFERPGGPRPVRLTAAGRLLLEHAEHVLDRVGAIERDLAAFKAGTEGRIDVGVFQSVAVKVVPEVVRRLRQESPGVDVRPFEDNDEQRLVAKVAAGELDLSFAVTMPGTAELRFVELSRDPYVAIVPLDRADSGVVNLDELASAPMVGQPSRDFCQRKIDAGLTAMGITPDYVFRTADNAAVQSMVRAGMGVAIMPLLAVDPNDPGVRICRLDPPMPPRELGLVVGPNPAPVVERFVELAVEVCADAVAAVRV
jgi:DNA-binding transcriptional LysR family regulator